MEERLIIKSKRHNAILFYLIPFLICSAFFLFSPISFLVSAFETGSRNWIVYLLWLLIELLVTLLVPFLMKTRFVKMAFVLALIRPFLSVMLPELLLPDRIGLLGLLVVNISLIGFWLTLPFVILGTVLFKWRDNCHIRVTDRRVIGVASFGKKVSIPLEMVVATALTPSGKGVFVYTASKKFAFRKLDDAARINHILSGMIMENKARSEQQFTQNQAHNDDTYWLQKYKELLDSGAISQAEYDAKKEQLLGL